MLKTCVASVLKSNSPLGIQADATNHRRHGNLYATIQPNSNYSYDFLADTDKYILPQRRIESGRTGQYFYSTNAVAYGQYRNEVCDYDTAEYYCNFGISCKGCTKLDYCGIKTKYPYYMCGKFDGTYSVLTIFLYLQVLSISTVVQTIIYFFFHFDILLVCGC